MPKSFDELRNDMSPQQREQNQQRAQDILADLAIDELLKKLNVVPDGKPALLSYPKYREFRKLFL